MSDEPLQVPNEKVIYLHGFSRKELFDLIDLIKKHTQDPRSIAFATSTKNNLTMTVSELIQEVRKDHSFMTGKETKASQQE